VVTLLDHLPSLRYAAAQRIAKDDWPRTTVVDELGRLCVGGVALTDIAAEFGTPVGVLDETELRHELRRYRADAGEMVPVLPGRAVPTTGFSACRGHDEHLGGQHANGHPLTGGELPGL
jgi:diaminopimelate decarboxylase